MLINFNQVHNLFDRLSPVYHLFIGYRNPRIGLTVTKFKIFQVFFIYFRLIS